MEPVTLDFFTEGSPQPQGSMRAFVVPGKWGERPRAAITTDNEKLKPWRDAVRWNASQAMKGAGLGIGGNRRLLVGVVRLEVTFYMRAPQDVAKKLQKGKSVECDHGYDADKLLRGIFDALSGTVYGDDKQVNVAHVERHWQHPSLAPGARVVVTGTPAAPPDPMAF